MQYDTIFLGAAVVFFRSSIPECRDELYIHSMTGDVLRMYPRIRDWHVNVTKISDDNRFKGSSVYYNWWNEKTVIDFDAEPYSLAAVESYCAMSTLRDRSILIVDFETIDEGMNWTIVDQHEKNFGMFILRAEPLQGLVKDGFDDIQSNTLIQRCRKLIFFPVNHQTWPLLVTSRFHHSCTRKI